MRDPELPAPVTRLAHDARIVAAARDGTLPATTFTAISRSYLHSSGLIQVNMLTAATPRAGVMACSNGYAGEGRRHGPLPKLLTASWLDPAIGANRRLTLTRLKSLSALGGSHAEDPRPCSDADAYRTSARCTRPRRRAEERRVRIRGRPGSSGHFFRGAPRLAKRTQQAWPCASPTSPCPLRSRAPSSPRGLRSSSLPSAAARLRPIPRSRARRGPPLSDR